MLLMLASTNSHQHTATMSRNGASSLCTVFVRNLAFDCTSGELEELFSDVGPLKHAFVVTEQQTTQPDAPAVAGRSRGFGFVEFRVPEDAERAIADLQGKEMHGRAMRLELANKRQPRAPKSAGDASADAAAEPAEQSVKPKEKKEKKEAKEKQNVQEHVASAVVAAPVVDTKPVPQPKIEDKPKSKPVKVAAPTPAPAPVATPAPAPVATPAESDSDDGDDESKSEPEESKPSKPVKQTPSASATATTVQGHSVLIDGLPSSADAKHLYKRVRKLGTVIKVVLPAPETVPGADTIAARVIYESMEVATKAVTKLNGATLFGVEVTAKLLSTKSARLIVRNLAFSCTEAALRTAFEVCGVIKSITLPRVPAEEGKEGRIKGFAFVEFENEASAAAAIQKINGSKIANRVVAVDWSLSQALYQQRQSASKGDDASGSDSGSESDSEPEVKKPRVKTSASSDVSQQRTVFVRNLPAHTTSSGLLSHFSQYGEVRRATPVNDKQTGAFNGTAFIEFVEKASADVLLSEAKPVSQVAKGKGAHNISLTEQMSSITFDGRPLIISLAMSRSQVQALSAERDAKEDKRHGHLAREGLILAGDEGSEGLSKQDLEKRSRLWTETKEKLKNPNFVVNPTRLSVKNLPLSVDDAQLRKLFADAAVAYATQHPKEATAGRVTLAKIVRDKQRVDAEGVSKSSGFGFVEFSSHEVALAALRQLNNNALAFTATKRPIVTFAVDDQRKLLIRQRKIDAQKQWRDENAKEKQTDDEGAKPTKKRKAEQSDTESEAKKPRTPEPADIKSAKAAKRKEIKQRKKELKRQLNAPAAAAAAATPVAVTEKPSVKPATSQPAKRKSAEPVAEAETPAAEPKAAKKSKNVKPDVKVSASKTEQKFDSMVESYKSQFFGSQAAKQATKRWFDQ